MATQKDVAKLSGLSQATVSLVLNDITDGLVSLKTIKKVNKAVLDLGYRPNRLARALRTSKTMTVACVIPDITNPYYPSLVRGVQVACENAGYDVIIVNTDAKRDRELHFFDLALQGRVDGLLGFFFHLDVSDFGILVEKEIPVVRLGSDLGNKFSAKIDNIHTDNISAARDLTDHMITKGHTKVSMIAGLGGPQLERVNGYKSAITNNKLVESIQLTDEFTEKGGFDATKSLFKLGASPSAIIAANDLMAIGCMRALRNLGLSIPEDVAVAGFDDIPASSLVTPSLTTVNLFQQDLGGVAARLLIERLTGEQNGPPKRQEHPYEIVQRNSA